MPAYEAIPEAREVARKRRQRLLKVGVPLVLVATAGTLLLVRSRRSASQAQAQATAADGKEDLFTIQSFPQDCVKYMRYEGCNRKTGDPKKDVYWSCEEDDYTLQFKCCCHEENGWPLSYGNGVGGGYSQAQSMVSTVSDIVDEGSDALLRLISKASMCLRGPGDGVGSFALWDCKDGQPDTRFQLPARGAGNIKWASKPGQCLALVKTMSGADTYEVEAKPCHPGSWEQMFQFTEGSHGMIQWSHTGNKCLDVEDGTIKEGKKIVLKPCVYWPKKESQQFELVKAPPMTKSLLKKKEKKEEKRKPGPLLFCNSLMLPWSYEKDMLRSQIQHGDGVGIFACDDWAVYSSEKVLLKDGDEPAYSDIMNGSLKAKIGGEFHTALNTPVFRRYWKRVIADPKAWRNDWIVKVDPDAVFFPDRLKEMVKNRWPSEGRPGGAVWLQNCQLGLHGPIEVFNVQALEVYKKREEECDSCAEDHGQEDAYLGACFAKLGIQQVNAYNLLLEWAWACNERPSSADNRPPCFDNQVSFHPYKTVKSYFHCYNWAKQIKFSSQLVPNGIPPSGANHHHA